MSKEIQITARLKIHRGKLDEFKRIAEACMKSVREKDTGASQYDWFCNEDQTECHVKERYRDSNAVLEHVANLGETFGHLLAVADFSAEVYGAPSEALLDATKDLELTVYAFFQKM